MLESAAYALNVVLPIAFGVTAAVYLVNFVRNRRAASTLARAALAASIFTACAMAVIRGLGEQHMPLSNAPEALSFFALSTTAVYAYLESRTGTQAMGIFVVGTAFAFQAAASLQYQPFAPAPAILHSGWFAVHATTSILSFSGFAIAAVMSALYLLLYRELHAGRPGYIFRRIPSLEALDDMAFQGVAVGFAMYAVGLVTGSIWAHQAWGRFWSWDPKQCSTLVVGMLYGGYLWARTRQGWSGRRVAYFAIFGFFMLLFTFVVVERIFPTEHRFV